MIEEVISNYYDVSETLNNFFENIVPNLKIIPSENFESTTLYKTENPVQKAINKFNQIRQRYSNQFVKRKAPIS